MLVEYRLVEFGMELIFRKEMKEAANKTEMLPQKEEEYAVKFSQPYEAIGRGFIDEVIDPKNTRKKLIRVFKDPIKNMGISHFKNE